MLVVLLGFAEQPLEAVGVDEDAQVRPHGGVGAGQALVQDQVGHIGQGLGAALVAGALVIGGWWAHHGLHRGADEAAVLLGEEAGQVPAVQGAHQLEVLAFFGLAVAALVGFGVGDLGAVAGQAAHLVDRQLPSLLQQEVLHALAVLGMLVWLVLAGGGLLLVGLGCGGAVLTAGVVDRFSEGGDPGG